MVIIYLCWLNKKPINNFKACDDLFLVMKCHIFTAATDMLGIENVNSIPSKYITYPEKVLMLTTEEDYFNVVATRMVWCISFIDLLNL